MGCKAAHFARTFGAFALGVGVGFWLRHPRGTLELHTYDREAASEAQAAVWRARGNRAALERWKGEGEHGGGTA